jgi:hypothetical protein
MKIINGEERHQLYIETAYIKKPKTGLRDYLSAEHNDDTFLTFTERNSRQNFGVPGFS